MSGNQEVSACNPADGSLQLYQDIRQRQHSKQQCCRPAAASEQRRVHSAAGSATTADSCCTSYTPVLDDMNYDVHDAQQRGEHLLHSHHLLEACGVQLVTTGVPVPLHVMLERSLLDMQVSAFGSDQATDGGDVWIVEWDTKAKHWKQDAKVGRVTSSCSAAVAVDSIQPMHDSSSLHQA